MDFPMIANRYELYKMIMKSDEGTWWRAHDNSLKREIILLQLEGEQQTATLKSLGADAVQVSGESFFQVLNAGTDGENSFVVFSPQTGMPLYQYAENHAMPLQSALEIVFTAGQRLQEGLRQGTPAFSVSFDNLWLTEKHELLVMNYWTEARSSRTGTFGLSSLLYQLCTLHPLAPRQYDTFVSRMQSALKYELPTQRSSVIALSKRVYQGDEPALSYMSTIKEIINQPSIPIAGAAEAEAAPVPEAHAEPLYTAPETASSSYHYADEIAAKDEPSGYSASEDEPAVERQIPEESNSSRMDRNRSHESQAGQGMKSKRTKRITIIAGCILFFSLLAGAVIWANQLSNSRDTAAETTDNASNQQHDEQETNQDQPTDQDSGSADSEQGSQDASSNNDSSEQGAQNQPDSSNQQPEETNTDEGSSQTNPDQSSGSDAANSNNGTDNGTGTSTPNGDTTPPATTDPTAPTEPVTPENPTTPGEPAEPGTELPAVEQGKAPNLVGLTKEDAEKQALAAGLKYSFVIESQEGGTKGTVFKQEPAAGSEVKKGDRITFSVVR